MEDKKRDRRTNFEIETQQNLMKIVEYLATDIFRPTTIDEITTALGLTYNKTLWTLHNLRLRGWADQVGDAWRLSPRIVKIAEAVRASIAENTKRYLGGGYGEERS